ncbi:MAG: tyrosine-protein phosphatase [Chlamydiota bacterium]
MHQGLPSIIHLGIRWRMEVLLTMADPSRRESIEELLQQARAMPAEGFPQHFYNQLGSVDVALRKSCLPYSPGRDRYLPVTPYQFNQAHLHDGTPLNASYIKFPEDHEDYPHASVFSIALSAPLPEYALQTLRYFAQSNIKTVVNLTDFEEGSHIKAHRYLPEKVGDCAVYWPATVRLLSVTEEDLSSSFHLTTKTCELYVDHYVHQFKEFHVQGWKDFTPGDPNTIALLIERVSEYEKGFDWSAGPCAVHCSAGVGRTGVVIGGKKIRELCLKGIEPNVRRIAASMRMQRTFLGGSREQYYMLWELAKIFKSRIA